MPDTVTRGVEAAYPSAADPADARDAALRALAWEIAGTAPRRSRRRLALAAGAVAVTLAGAGVARMGLPGEAGLTPRADAATVKALETGARAAERAPSGPVVKPGQYLFTHSRNLTQVGSQSVGDSQMTYYVVGGDRWSWIGADGAFRLVEKKDPGSIRFLAGDRAHFDAEVARIAAEGPYDERTPEERWTVSDAFAQAGAPDADLAARYDDPAGAADLLKDAAGHYGGKNAVEEMFVMVGDGLRESDLSPRARAALFRAAAYIPGVTADGTARDSAGRRGIAVSRDQDGIREVLIFDPATSQLLEEQQRTTGPVEWLPGVPAGTVIGRSTYLESAVVDSDSATP